MCERKWEKEGGSDKKYTREFAIAMCLTLKIYFCGMIWGRRHSGHLCYVFCYYVLHIDQHITLSKMTSCHLYAYIKMKQDNVLIMCLIFSVTYSSTMVDTHFKYGQSLNNEVSVYGNNPCQGKSQASDCTHCSISDTCLICMISLGRDALNMVIFGAQLWVWARELKWLSDSVWTKSLHQGSVLF